MFSVINKHVGQYFILGMLVILVSVSVWVPAPASAATLDETPALSGLWDSVHALLIQLRAFEPAGQVKGATTSTLSQTEIDARVVYLQKKIVQVDCYTDFFS